MWAKILKSIGVLFVVACCIVWVWLAFNLVWEIVMFAVGSP